MCSSRARQVASTLGVTAYMRAFMIQALTASPGLAELARPALDEAGDRLAPRRIERRRDVLRQQLVPYESGALGGVARPRLGPALEARPVRGQRPIESRRGGG